MSTKADNAVVAALGGIVALVLLLSIMTLVLLLRTKKLVLCKCKLLLFMINNKDTLEYMWFTCRKKIYIMPSLYYIDTRDVRNELLIVPYLDIHVGHYKK